jgi:hypothetical protein
MEKTSKVKTEHETTEKPLKGDIKGDPIATIDFKAKSFKEK